MDLKEFLSKMDNTSNDINEAQLKREWDRCKEAVLEDIINYDDGAYKGEIKAEFRDLIYDHLKLDQRLDETAFEIMLSKMANKMVVWILEATTGVSSDVANTFVGDFLQKIMGTMFSVEQIDGPEDGFDPMYG